MNEIVNNFLLTGDKFMPEMHLKQLVQLTVLVFHLQKSKEKIEKFIQKGSAYQQKTMQNYQNY